MRKIVFIIFMCFLGINVLKGQDVILPENQKYKGWSPAVINFDSQTKFEKGDLLRAKIRSSKTKIDKIKALNSIAEFYNNGNVINVDSVKYYYNQVFLEIDESARRSNKEIGRQYLLALQTKAFVNGRLIPPKIDLMFTQLLKVKEIAIDENDLYNLAEVYNNLGVFYGMIGNLDSARHNFLKAIELGEEINFHKVLSNSYSNIVFLVPENEKLQKEILLRALYNICKRPEINAGHFFQVIGFLAEIETSTDLSKAYSNTIDELIELISDPEIKAEAYFYIGISHIKEMAQAYNYLSKALYYANQGGNLSLQGSINHVIADLYLNLGEFQMSEKYHNSALKKFEEVDDETGIHSIVAHMLREYIMKKKYSEALSVLDKITIDNSKEGKFQRLQRLSIMLIINSKNGDYEKSKILLDSLDMMVNDTSLTFSFEHSELLNYAKIIYYYNTDQFEYSLKGIEEYLLKNNLFIRGSNLKSELLEKGYIIEKGKGNISQALTYHEGLIDEIQAQNITEEAKNIAKLEFREKLKLDSLTNADKAYKTELKYELQLSKDKRDKNVLLSSALILFILSGGFYLRWRATTKAKNIIEFEKNIAEKERARSDHLLLNILPAEIAEELKNTGESAARQFDEVSILFTDFKDFTKHSAKLSATNLVHEINHCFEAFDGIMDKYGIEKIKTIGDAYMAAGGLPVPTKISVKNTVLAALEMQIFMIRRKNELETVGKSGFEMRVGIHTGPAVAGIVGVKKFQYDIWGDTVNTASRMESAGQVGKVNISQATYNLLKHDPQFSFESRGMIEAKGKGQMEMWFVWS
jgi:adenylate cyclase